MVVAHTNHKFRQCVLSRCGVVTAATVAPLINKLNNAVLNSERARLSRTQNICHV